MAKWIQWTPSQEEGYRVWMESRPQVIRDMAEQHNLRADTLYRLTTTGQRVTLQALDEDGTVTITVADVYNPERMIPFGGLMDRNVFGVNPADLQECELPPGVEVEPGEDIDAATIEALKNEQPS